MYCVFASVVSLHSLALRKAYDMTVVEICALWNKHDTQRYAYAGSMRIEWLQRTRDAMLQLIEQSNLNYDVKFTEEDFVVGLEMVDKNNRVWIQFILKPRSEL